MEEPFCGTFLGKQKEKQKQEGKEKQKQKQTQKQKQKQKQNKSKNESSNNNNDETCDTTKKKTPGNLGREMSGEPWQPPGGTWGTRGNQLSTRAAARGNLGGTFSRPFLKDFLREAWGNLGGTLSRLRAAEQPSSRAGEPGGARHQHRPRSSKNTLGCAYW